MKNNYYWILKTTKKYYNINLSVMQYQHFPVTANHLITISVNYFSIKASSPSPLILSHPTATAFSSRGARAAVRHAALEHSLSHTHKQTETRAHASTLPVLYTTESHCTQTSLPAINKTYHASTLQQQRVYSLQLRE